MCFRLKEMGPHSWKWVVKGGVENNDVLYGYCQSHSWNAVQYEIANIATRPCHVKTQYPHLSRRNMYLLRFAQPLYETRTPGRTAFTSVRVPNPSVPCLRLAAADLLASSRFERTTHTLFDFSPSRVKSVAST